MLGQKKKKNETKKVELDQYHYNRKNKNITKKSNMDGVFNPDSVLQLQKMNIVNFKTLKHKSNNSVKKKKLSAWDSYPDVIKV